MVGSHPKQSVFQSFDELRMSDVARYPAEDVLGLSFYDLIHSIDLPQVGTSFRNCKKSYPEKPKIYAFCPVREHGQCWTPPYRLLVRGGGFCWLQTRSDRGLEIKNKTTRSLLTELCASRPDEEAVAARTSTASTTS